MNFLNRIITKQTLQYSFVVLCLLVLASCSSTQKMTLENPTWDAQTFFNEGKDRRAQGNYAEAINLFESLEARFPFSEYAASVPLEIAYTYYQQGEDTLAIAQLDRFIKNNPEHPNLDYAYYMRGYINYNRGRGLLARFTDNPEKRDTSPLRRAFDYFKELIERFPNSKYTAKASDFFFQIRDVLAAYELEVAYYYTDRGATVGAINRLNYIVQNYQDTKVLAETLALLEHNYQKSGMTTEAENTRKVLDLNFPNYQMLYKIKG